MVAARPRKRRPKPRVLVRGESVVRGVMEATLAKLASAGYGALRIEDVATSAGVNKTTVYRRWPTKEELVRAALLSITASRMGPPNTGSLRTDILEMARRMVALVGSCEGQGLFRMILAAGPDSELMAIATSLKKGHEAVPRAVIEAAAARGELAPGVEAMLLFSVLWPAIHHRIMMERAAVDDDFLCRLVDLLLFGAMPRGDRPKAADPPPVAVVPPVEEKG
jgi:AcrR family transcriptional regulator